MVYCSKCGALISTGAKFCENCGEPVLYENETEQTTEETEQYDSNVYETTVPTDRIDENLTPDKSANKFGIAALVLGILAAVMVFAAWHPAVTPIDLIFGILAIVFGSIGMKRAKQNNSSSGMAIAGLICGIVAVSVAGFAMLCVGSCAIAACSTAGLAENLPRPF